MEYFSKIEKSAEFLVNRFKTDPEIGIIAGTGLGDCAGSIKETGKIEYSEIPGFPVSTVDSHDGELVFGEIENRQVVIMRGRFHLYEGYTPKEVAFPVRVMQKMGVKTLIVTNASGALNLSFAEGDIMIIKDHINLTGMSPLTGENNDNWGLRFPDMIGAYDRDLADRAYETGKKLNIPVKRGVYTGLQGPSLETPAEMKFLKIIGGDAVGFSTIQEVIAGVHGGMKILGLSMIANINNPEDPVPATLESVISVMKKSSLKLEKLLINLISKKS